MYGLRRRSLGLLGSAITLMIAGCGPTAETSPAPAQRVIDIVANDSLRFAPDHVTVRTGETVTFRVTNTGRSPHEFVLGDEAAQQRHEDAMTHGDMSMDMMANAVDLPAGGTATLTYRFAEAGTVIYGCHVAGHYAAGMRGTVTVTP